MRGLNQRFPECSMLSVPLLQPQPHLVRLSKSERFIERAAKFAGVQRDRAEAVGLAPVDGSLHQLAGDTLAAMFGINVEVEDIGAARLRVPGMRRPGTDGDGAASGDLAIGGNKQTRRETPLAAYLRADISRRRPAWVREGWCRRRPCLQTWRGGDGEFPECRLRLPGG
jgi:hypothetical protein